MSRPGAPCASLNLHAHMALTVPPPPPPMFTLCAESGAVDWRASTRLGNCRRRGAAFLRHLERSSPRQQRVGPESQQGAGGLL